ncbi:hypothetical protein BDV97DRAFT_1635 [Delphinella strobiligena]|nr:hypothetical protein BDV97DRAFT_1635 [Delphinella strobiligena]
MKRKRSLAIDAPGNSTSSITNNVVETDEATIEPPPPEDTDRETVGVRDSSGKPTQGAEQEDSPEIEVQTLLAQDYAHEVPKTAVPANHEEQEQAYDAFVEGSVEDAIDAATEAFDGGLVHDPATTDLDKPSDRGSTEEPREGSVGLSGEEGVDTSTEEPREGSVELSGEAVVDTSTERTAQESTNSTVEHDEVITPAGMSTGERTSKPGGQGTEDPTPEYDHVTEDHGIEDVTEDIEDVTEGIEDVTEGINNHDHVHSHINNQGNDQEDSFKDWDWLDLQGSIDREAER